VSIIAGAETDLVAACELWFRADAARRSTEMDLAEPAALAAEIGELYRRPPVHLLLARPATGELVGTVLGKPRRQQPQVGQISLLAVAPSWQGRGIGSMLLDEAVGRLRATGCSSGRMYVRADDAGLHRFYEKRGWSATGEIEEEPATGQPERVFVRGFAVA